MNNPIPRFLAACCLCLASLQVMATEIDLTRHLSRHGVDDPLIQVFSFTAEAGAGRLVLQGDAGDSLVLTLNDKALPPLVTGEEQAVTLATQNTLTVARTEPTAATIRVRQRAVVDLQVQSRIHFNTNVSSFTAAKAFYEMIGFESITGFPDTNTQAMARAIGIETPTEYDGSQGDFAGGYLLHGEIIGANGFTNGVIDLIEFTIPRNEEPPYERLDHLGMVSAAMYTADIMNDHKVMTGKGVEFLSPPVQRADGSLFAMFKDLDGTFYELVGFEGEVSEEEDTQIACLGEVTINVSDLERSLAWYQMLGFEMLEKLPRSESLAVANAMGFDQTFEIDGAMIKHRVDGSRLKLVEWLSPGNLSSRDVEPPYPVPVNHLGIHRMAFTSSDIEADVAALEAQGVELISPITPCCSGEDASSSIVAFYDPDGVVMELASQPAFMNWLVGAYRWVNQHILDAEPSPCQG